MKPLTLIALAACLPASAQVKFFVDGDIVRVEVAGKPYSDFHLGKDAGKPYLWPLRSASGKILTRRFPMEQIAEESHDHPHQRGLFFAYENVNGADFWNNELTYKTPNRGRIVLDKVLEKSNGKDSGHLRTRFRWMDQNGKYLLLEDRRMTFYDDPQNRVIDFDITLTAPEERVTFGDAKDGAFGIRIADALREEKGGGHIVSDTGASGESQVWGKRWNWVDYNGVVDGEKVGIAVFDHPGNPGRPPRWHVRGYGLFAVNPFGAHVFDKAAPENTVVLEKGKSLRFRWRVVIHPGDAAGANLNSLYSEYASPKRRPAKGRPAG